MTTLSRWPPNFVSALALPLSSSPPRGSEEDAEDESRTLTTRKQPLSLLRLDPSCCDGKTRVTERPATASAARLWGVRASPALLDVLQQKTLRKEARSSRKKRLKTDMRIGFTEVFTVPARKETDRSFVVVVIVFLNE